MKPAAARRHLASLAVYGLLSVLLSWPLAARLNSHVPGIEQWAFDESTFVWNIWQFKHALIDQLGNPLHTELVYYPLGIDLVLYTYNFYHVLAALPLALAGSLPLASNLALLASTTLSGYGAYLLVHWLLREEEGAAARPAARQAAALVAGLIFAFASNRAIYAALGHYDMVTTQWIPFYALALLRSLDRALAPARRRRAALLAGVFFAFNGLAEMITALFLAIFTLIVAAGWWLDRRGRGRREADARLFLTSLGLIGGTALVLWGPALLPILRQFLTDDFSLKGWGEAIPLSTDLLGWFTPSVLHPLWGGDLVAELRRVQLRALEPSATGFRDINTVFLGWVTLALAAAGALRYSRRLVVWIWTSLLFGLFTLGPFLQINGVYRFNLDGEEATFPLPYALLHYLPIIKANRAPNRNSVLLMLGLAVLAGYALWWLLGRLARRGGERRWAAAVGGAAAALVLFEHLAVPAPLSDARIPAVYEQIAADPRPVSVMHVPLGWRNSFGVFGPEETRLQYYQSSHGKPMLGGNISRAPDFKMDYFRRLPFFQALTNIEFGAPVNEETLAAARAQADELMYLYNTGYVLLYPPVPNRFPYADHWQAAWNFVKETLPLEDEPFWSEGGIEAYRVVQPEGDDRFRLDLGEAGTFAYRGEGWDAAESDTLYDTPAIWATGEASRLFAPLRNVQAAAPYTLRMRAHPFGYGDAPAQSVTPVVNGHALPAQPLAEGWQEVAWEVQGEWLVDGLNRLELRWGGAAAPREVVGGSRQIGGTGVELPIDADLKAFGEGGFIALFDEAGEQSDASAGRRGVNVTVLEPKSGAVLDKRGFDTAANEFESEALAEYLSRVEAGRIVLVASSGDATAHLTDEAVAALRGVGADVTADSLRGGYFALVGVQGAAPGSAAVAVDPNEAYLSISLPRDRRPLAAAVDYVEIAPATP